MQPKARTRQSKRVAAQRCQLARQRLFEFNVRASIENKRRFIRQKKPPPKKKRRGTDLEADAFGVNHEDEPVQEEGEEDGRPSDAFVVQGDHGEDGVGCEGRDNFELENH